MKRIKLTRGAFALVDTRDFKRVSRFKWHLREQKTGLTQYAANNRGRGGKSKDIYMHRLILNAQSHELVDHRNGNGLDNRRKNLRFSNRTVNGLNKHCPSKSSSGKRGVHWHESMGRWRARVKIKGKEIVLGYFNSIAKASVAYQSFVRPLIGAK